MNLGLFIIGDEILSGRRKDRHLEAVIEILKKHKLQLCWSMVLGDDFDLLVKSFRQSLANRDYVLCTGGIGATPDDLTRQALAEAAGVPLQRHPEGVSLLMDIYHGRLTEHRFRMIEFPQGADLIPNPVNRIPGFGFCNHYCVPGFPQMAWPMMEWVLQYHPFPSAASDYTESAVRVTGVAEGDLIPLMETLLQQYQDLKVFSLPVIDEDRHYIDLGVKGKEACVVAAMQALVANLKQRNCEWQLL